MMEAIFAPWMGCVISIFELRGRKSELKPQDIIVGKEYYGYIQKMDPDRKFARVRLTRAVEEDIKNV